MRNAMVVVFCFLLFVAGVCFVVPIAGTIGEWIAGKIYEYLDGQ